MITIRVVCAWCGRELGRVRVAGPGMTSHGICPACERAMLKELEEARPK